MVGAEVEAFAAAVGESARAFEDAVPAVAAMPRRTNRTAIAAMEIVRLGVDTGIIANLKAGRAVQDALAAFADLTRGADAATCLSASVTSAAMLPIALMIDARPAAELKSAAAGRLAAPAAANRARRTRGRVRAARPAGLVIGREVHADAAAFGKGRGAARGARSVITDLTRAAAQRSATIVASRAILIVAPEVTAFAAAEDLIRRTARDALAARADLARAADLAIIESVGVTSAAMIAVRIEVHAAAIAELKRRAAGRLTFTDAAHRPRRARGGRLTIRTASLVIGEDIDAFAIAGNERLRAVRRADAVAADGSSAATDSAPAIILRGAILIVAPKVTAFAVAEDLICRAARNARALSADLTGFAGISACTAVHAIARGVAADKTPALFAARLRAGADELAAALDALFARSALSRAIAAGEAIVLRIAADASAIDELSAARHAAAALIAEEALRGADARRCAAFALIADTAIIRIVQRVPACAIAEDLPRRALSDAGAAHAYLARAARDRVIAARPAGVPIVRKIDAASPAIRKAGSAGDAAAALIAKKSFVAAREVIAARSARRATIFGIVSRIAARSAAFDEPRSAFGAA